MNCENSNRCISCCPIKYSNIRCKCANKINCDVLIMYQNERKPAWEYINKALKTFDDGISSINSVDLGTTTWRSVSMQYFFKLFDVKDMSARGHRITMVCSCIIVEPNFGPDKNTQHQQVVFEKGRCITRFFSFTPGCTLCLRFLPFWALHIILPNVCK